MKRKLMVLLMALVVVSSCASSVQSPTSSQVPIAILIAQGQDISVFKFQDGDTVCYFTETTFIASEQAGGIFCK